MSWGHAVSLIDFGAMVTARIGAAAAFSFRVPLGILPASEISRAVVSFVPTPNAAVAVQGELRLTLELGTGPTLTDESYTPIARGDDDGTEFVVRTVGDVATNRLHELVVLSPALDDLFPVWLKVAGFYDPMAAEPAIWEILDAALVTIELKLEAPQASPTPPQLAELERVETR